MSRFSLAPRAAVQRGAPWIAGVVFVVMLSGLFGLRAVIDHASAALDVDQAVAALVSTIRRPWLDQLMMALSAFGDGLQRVAITLAMAIYLAFRRRWRWAVGLLAAAAVTTALVALFKATFHVARPSPIYSGIQAFSFPSGHVAQATVLYAVLAWVSAQALAPRWRAVPYGFAALWIALTGLSRIYVGAHWPSDVLASLMLGIAIAAPALVYLRSTQQAGAAAPEPRHYLVIVACLIGVAVTMMPRAMVEANATYGPFLARPDARLGDLRGVAASP